MNEAERRPAPMPRLHPACAYLEIEPPHGEFLPRGPAFLGPPRCDPGRPWPQASVTAPLFWPARCFDLQDKPKVGGPKPTTIEFTSWPAGYSRYAGLRAQLMLIWENFCCWSRPTQTALTPCKAPHWVPAVNLVGVG